MNNYSGLQGISALNSAANEYNWALKNACKIVKPLVIMVLNACHQSPLPLLILLYFVKII